MKRLCSFIAFVSCTGFAILIAAALFQMFIITPRSHIALQLPKYHATNDVAYYDALNCMAANIYNEAQGEDAKGKMMVGLVVLERMKSVHFPSTICGVVYQANHDAHGRVIHNQCSFSWVCDGHDHSVDFNNIIDRREWMTSYSVAALVMAGKLKADIDMQGVTYYHAKYVKPYWAKDHKDYKMVARVGDHMFYRWKKAMLPKYNSVAAL